VATNEKVSRPRIDEEKFIKVWARTHKKGGYLQNVADEVGCTLAGASAKAKNLIEAGVKLPQLARSPRNNGRDVKSLNDTLKAELSK